MGAEQSGWRWPELRTSATKWVEVAQAVTAVWCVLGLIGAVGVGTIEDDGDGLFDRSSYRTSSRRSGSASVCCSSQRSCMRSWRSPAGVSPRRIRARVGRQLATFRSGARFDPESGRAQLRVRRRRGWWTTPASHCYRLAVVGCSQTTPPGTRGDVETRRGDSEQSPARATRRPGTTCRRIRLVSDRLAHRLGRCSR